MKMTGLKLLFVALLAVVVFRYPVSAHAGATFCNVGMSACQSQCESQMNSCTSSCFQESESNYAYQTFCWGLFDLYPESTNGKLLGYSANAYQGCQQFPVGSNPSCISACVGQIGGCETSCFDTYCN